MPILRAQIRIPHTSGVSEDTVINTLHFTCTGWSEGLRADITTNIVAFYEALDAYKGGDHNWAGARIKWYDLDQPEPRVPLADVGLALSTAPSGALPYEVAYCISYKAEYVSGASAARRRGRLFFGPLNTSAVSATGGRPPTGLRTAAVAAGGALLTASNLASDWAWVVWSPTSEQAFPVVGGWCDDELDTQRRRGRKPTVRSTF